jgi:hypothetical protein
MFCPNCGSKNGVEQNYCRGCGLKFDAIVEAVADQFPSKEYAALQRRKERFEKLGLFSLSVAGFIGFALLLFKAAQYKIILFGPDVLMWSAIVALIGFLLLSVGFFNYPKLCLKGKNLPADDGQTPDVATEKLLGDRPPDYVSSVTENTTKSLRTPAKGRLS